MTDDQTLDAQLRQREAQRRDALLAGDRRLLAELLTDDLVHVHTTGRVHDKAQLLDHATGFLRFIDVRREDLLIRALGPDVAVMTGPMINLVQQRGTDETVEVRAFVTQVWVRRDATWRIASFHAVRTN